METAPQRQNYNLVEDDIDEFVNVQETRPNLKRIQQLVA